MQSIICVCSEQVQIIDCTQTLGKRGTNCLAHDKIRQDVNRPLAYTCGVPRLARDFNSGRKNCHLYTVKDYSSVGREMGCKEGGNWLDIRGRIYTQSLSIHENKYQRLTHDQTFTWHRWPSPTLLLQWKTKKSKNSLFNQRTFRLNTLNFEKQCVFFLPKCMEAVASDEIFASW